MDKGKQRQPLISVIVTTKNSARTIDRCLKCISQQLYSNIEIIVVDNDSSDATCRIASKYTDKIFIQGPERSAQRNVGIEMAKGEYILYLDSDQYIHKMTLLSCLFHSLFRGLDMINIPELNWPFNLLNRSINYEKEFTSYNRDKALPRFFKKKVFDKIGGFNEQRTFDEDVELLVRARKAGFTQGDIFFPILHDEATSVWKIIKKYCYYGSISGLSDNMPYNHEIRIYYGFDRQFIKNLWKFFWKNPIMFCCGFTIKTFKYCAFVTGMLTRGGEYY